MTTPNLAKIERVDLREAWPNEARDFTPWLAENLDQLGDALGLRLEWQQTEAEVGSYSLDLLARDVVGDRPVIVENQLEPTNHDHLGKLLTYAAWYEANVVVWLTNEFSEEHLQAMHWLNQRTSEGTEFFGVVVELWRIGDSPYAPHLKVVAAPGELRKSRGRSDSLSPRQEVSLAFRQGLIEKLSRGHGIIPRTRANASGAYLVVDNVLSRAWYAAIWHNGKPGLELYVDKRGTEGPQWNQMIFQALEQDRESVELVLADSKLGEWVVWEPAEGRKRHARVAIYRTGDVFQNQESWAEFQDWMIQKLHKFRQEITPRLKEFSIQE